MERLSTDRQEMFISNATKILGGKNSIWRAKPVKSVFDLINLNRSFTSFGILVINIVILTGVMLVVAYGSSTSNHSTGQAAVLNSEQAVMPVDSLSSSDIAVHLARMSNLQTAPAVSLQADTQREYMSVSPGDGSSTADKPQIVNTDLKSRHDIQNYTVQDGDTISAIAKKFGVTSDSIRWSNDLGASNSIAVGTELVVPPIEGIVYQVEEGDSAENLATKYNSDKDKLIAFNDAELDGLPVGKHIVIPNGEKPAPTVRRSFSYGGGYSTISPRYGGNAYVAGTCTYYVANRVSVPNNWGNASSWAYNANRTSGWSVTKTPRAGAIVQSSSGSWYAGGYGHVGYVERVSDDGRSMWISDMNYGARWYVRNSVKMSVHSGFNFIHRN